MCRKLQACEKDADCASLGAGAACTNGLCRVPCGTDGACTAPMACVGGQGGSCAYADTLKFDPAICPARALAAVPAWTTPTAWIRPRCRIP